MAASPYDALLEPEPKASPYDALLSPEKQASPYDSLLSPETPKPDVSKLIADPNYDPAAHAAPFNDGHPEYETAFQARQALNHRTFGEKVGAAGSKLLEPSTYWDAAAGAFKWGAGLVTAPLHFTAQAGATIAAPLAGMAGDSNLQNTLENEQQTEAAESVQAEQHVEEGLKKSARGIRNLTQGIGHWTGLSPEDEATERAHFAEEVAAYKNQQQLAQSRPLETGAMASAVKFTTGQDKLSDMYSSEALEAQGARPVSPFLTETMAMVDDPTNILLPLAGRIPGVAIVAGGAMQGAGKALKGAATGLRYLSRTSEAVHAPWWSAIATHNPLVGVKVWAGKLGAQLGANALEFGGEALDAQGGALRTGIPSALDTASQSTLTAGESALGTNAQRLIGDTAGHALATGIGFAPVNLAMSGGDPRQFAESEVGASVVGAMMALPGETFANRPTMERIAAYRLAHDGANQFTENPVFPAHQAQMQTFDRGSQDVINRLRSYLYRGTGTDVLVLDGKTYADAVGAIGGDTRGHFTATPDGRTIYLNADAVASGEKPGTPAQKATKVGSTAGHEAGHAIVDFLKTAGREGDAQGLFSAIQSGMKPEQLSALTTEYHAALSRSTPPKPGEAPEQRQAIKAKIVADNPPEKILEENLSEITRKILDGQSVASFALPKPILERLTDAAAGWLERRGLSPAIDPKATLAFKAQMVKEAARRMKTVLYETGKRASAAIDAGPTVTQEIIRAKDAISKIPEIKPDMPSAQAAAISRQRTAAEKDLAQWQARAGNAPEPPETTSTPQEAAEGRTRAQEGQAAAAEQLKAEGIDRAWPRIREAMARNPNLSEADEIADYVRKLAAEKNAIADARTILMSNALKYTATEAKQFTDAVIAAHQEPVTDVQKLVKAAQRLKAGGKVEPGEFNRPDKPSPRVGATFNDAAGNTHTVTGSTDRDAKPGDFILTRDGRTQRVVGPSPDGQGVETVGTFIADESRTTPARNGTFTILETKADPKVETAPQPVSQTPPTPEPAASPAPPETTPAVTTPPEVETPEFRIVPLGQSGRLQIIDRAGNPTSKNTFASEKDAQQSIDQQGRGRFQLPPPIMDDAGNPVYDILDAILNQVGGIYFDKLGKEEKQQSLPANIRGLLRSENPKNAPDAVATVLGYDSYQKMFDDIASAIEARRRGKKQSAQEAAKQRIAAREESQEPNEPPITDQPISPSTTTAVENPLETPHPAEPAPLQFDEIAQIAASAKESAIAAEKPKKDGSYTKKAQEAIRKAELMAVIRAHSDRLPLNYKGIRLRTDQFGKETVTGTLDASRPFDIWLLRESGMSPQGIDHLGELQDMIGMTVQIDYRHASTGEEITTADTRRHAQKVESAEQRASGEAAGEIQRKTVVPLEIAFNPGTESFTILGASPEKLLSNFQHLSEAMAAAGEEVPYPDIHDPHFVADWKGYIRNHDNNRQGDGTPMTDANGARVTPTGPAYRIQEARFEFLNAVLGDEGAKADTAKGKEKATLAQHNARMVNNETGETNPLRDRLNKAIVPMPELDKDGKPVLDKDGNPKMKTWSKATLENPISENIRPDLVEAIHPELTREDSSIREHGYKGDIGRFFSEGIPDRPSVAAGFMPNDSDLPPSATQQERALERLGIGQSNLTAPVEKNVNDALLMTGGDPEKAKAFLSQYLAKAAPEVAENLKAAIAELDRRHLKSFMPDDESVKSDLKTMRDKWKDDGISVTAYARGDDITLSEIRVPKDQRGQGIGTKTMQELLDYAQSNGMRVLLTPSTDFGATSKARLERFYRSFGFVKNAGRNKDFGTSETMIWTPKDESKSFMLNSPDASPRSPAPRPAIPAYRVAAMTRLKDRERQLATSR